MKRMWSADSTLNIRHDISRLLRIEPSHVALIAAARAHRGPDVLVGLLNHLQLTVTTPAQAVLRIHGAVAKAAVRDPFGHNVTDKGDLTAEVVGFRDALDERVDLVFGRARRDAAAAAADCCGLDDKVEQRLQWVG